MIDTIATLALGGRLSGRARTSALLLALALTPQPGRADDTQAVEATAETTLGYVLTGDAQVDRISERGLVGLGGALTDRTAVEPGPPVGVNPEVDELAFYPVLYWPLLGTSLPSDLALQRLAKYLAGGGMLLIDTQSGRSGFGAASGAQMRQIARTLNLPPLAPVDADHVLTRSFYLLSSFPGRWRGERIWAETPPEVSTQRAEDADLPQFDRVDDNVSPVVVGSADWAAAWAVDNQGFAMFPIGRPGDQQREMALRFGINLVMYALTGNYKSDQVHAPRGAATPGPIGGRDGLQPRLRPRSRLVAHRRPGRLRRRHGGPRALAPPAGLGPARAGLRPGCSPPSPGRNCSERRARG